MNSAAFLTMISESMNLKRDNPIKIFSHGGNVIVDINGESWDDITLDKCVEKIKQSFAIKYLEQLKS